MDGKEKYGNGIIRKLERKFIISQQRIIMFLWFLFLYHHFIMILALAFGFSCSVFFFPFRRDDFPRLFAKVFLLLVFYNLMWVLGKVSFLLFFNGFGLLAFPHFIFFFNFIKFD